MKISVKDITRDELVSIFCCIWDMWSYFSLETATIPEGFDNSNCNCREEYLADVLLKGGKLVYIDHENDDTKHEFDLSLAKRRLGYPEAYQYLAKIIDESYDDYTSWAIIQMMSFGKTIYG